MNHTLKIGVGFDTPTSGDQSLADRIVCCRKLDIRKRIMRLLFGEKQRLTIIVPGESVKSLSIVEEGGTPDDTR